MTATYGADAAWARPLALAWALGSAAFPSAASADEPTVVDSCGRAFLSLPAEAAPASLTWTEYAEPFDGYFGVDALSNGGPDTDRRYQCTEYAHRFVREIYGAPTRIGLGLGHGNYVAQGIAEHFGDEAWSTPRIAPHAVRLSHHANGATECRPVVGSVVSLAIGRYGHVGVVRDIAETEEGGLDATLVAQHGFFDEIGGRLEPEIVRFRQDEAGVWSARWTARDGSEHDATGWLNPEIAD